MLPPGIRLLANVEPGELPSEVHVSSGQSAFNFEEQSEANASLVMADAPALSSQLTEGRNNGKVFDETINVISMAQSWDSFPEQGLPLKQHMVDIERSLIQQALDKAEGNVSKTARLLNVQRTTLIEKINKYGLSSA